MVSDISDISERAESNGVDLVERGRDLMTTDWLATAVNTITSSLK